MRSNTEQLRRRLEADYLDHSRQELEEGDGSASLRRMMTAIVRAYLEDLELAASLGQRIASLEEHLARIERRAEKKGQLVAVAMEEAEIESMIDPSFIVRRIRPIGSLVINEQNAVPERFWREMRALDEEAIVAALRAGEVVPGASLAASEPMISVRTL